MHDPLPTLSADALATTCGGGTSSRTTSLRVTATPPPGKQIDLADERLRVSRTDREACVLGVKQLGGTPADIAAVCGPSP
jgi:hypothetical protein